MKISDINSLYKGALPDSYLHNLDGLVVPFNPDWKNVAVNVSGGADSALLASLLAQLIKKNNYDCKVHFISFIRVWEFRPWAPFISQEVYKKIKEMFPSSVGDRIESFIPTELEEGVSGADLVKGKSGDRIIVNSFNKYAVYRYNLDAVYNATTLNPSDLSVGQAEGTNKRPKDREESWYAGAGLEKLVNKEENKKDAWMLYPFRYVEKDYVIGGYYKNGWEDLLNTTRSCEGDKHTDPDLFASYLSYKHGETKLPLCGHCFWCEERNWATNKVKNET